MTSDIAPVGSTASMLSQLPDEQRLVGRWSGDIGTPVVSVLCHAFNQADYVEATLVSILRQVTDFPFEIIVRDDASSDGTADIIARYAERFPRIIRPMMESRNRYSDGIKPIAASFPLARGEFVALCEGDDYWLGTDKLQTQVDYMREHPEAGAVHGNYLNLIHLAGAWRTRVAFRHRRQLRHRSGNIYAAMLQANRIQTCTLLCRRSLVADYRSRWPRVDGYLVGDWPLSLYLSHESEIGFITRPLAAYRRTPGSLTNSGHAAVVSLGLDAIRMVGEFCDFFDDRADVRQAALAAQYRVLLWLAFRAGDRPRFDQAMEWLAVNAPATLGSMRARLMCATIGLPRVRNAELGMLAMIEAVKHCIEFRKRDGEVEG